MKANDILPHMTATDRERFLNRHISRNPVSGCWNWTGDKDRKWYGLYQVPSHIAGKESKVKCRAHRLSWVLHHGPIPADLHVLHRCDNTRCVNPDHLKLGTNADNIEDAVRRGSRSRLSDDEVRAIRASADPHPDIAAKYGITRSTVSKIKRGTLRASVT